MWLWKPTAYPGQLGVPKVSQYEIPVRRGFVPKLRSNHREREWQVLAARGFLQRTDQQFHWENAGYATFDDFLGALAARKRKVLKRERRDALANGITVDRLTGTDLTEAAWDDFFNRPPIDFPEREQPIAERRAKL